MRDGAGLPDTDDVAECAGLPDTDDVKLIAGLCDTDSVVDDAVLSGSADLHDHSPLLLVPFDIQPYGGLHACLV